MKLQDYIVKKFVRASSVPEALSAAEKEPVHEVYLVEAVPDGMGSKSKETKDAVGFASTPEPFAEEEL
jgi:hypothetical protein